MLATLSIIWVVVTVILVLLSIHRSILVMREEDTIFLSEAEASMRAQYAEVLSRLRRLELVLKIFTFASGGLMLLIAALWAYQGLYG
jgi:ACT domain-containing protein